MSTSELKTVSADEFQLHTTKDSLWVLIHGKVHDATKFIDEHPGGDEVILGEAGKDATEAFEDIGHSDEAREMLAGLVIGSLEEGGLAKLNMPKRPTGPAPSPRSMVEKGSNVFYVPLAVILAYFAWRYYSTLV